MAITADPDLSRITVIAGQRSGQPCIRGLRITVWDVLDMLASGMTEDEILGDYPYLEKVDFPAVFAAIERSGYAGWVGAEYLPSRTTEATLGWFAPYRRKTPG